jgi:hypothetical protein
MPFNRGHLVRLTHSGAVSTFIALNSLFALIIWTMGPVPISEHATWNTRLLTEQERFDQEVDDRLRVLREMRVAQTAIARDLANGKLTLLEAATLTRELHRDEPACLSTMWAKNSAVSEAERFCRQIMQYLPPAHPDGPEFEALFARFEAELQHHLKCGTLRLDNRISESGPP